MAIISNFTMLAAQQQSVIWYAFDNYYFYNKYRKKHHNFEHQGFKPTLQK